MGVMSLKLSRSDLLEVVSPVLPWVGKDHSVPVFTLVRLLAHEGFVYATASDGRSAAIARTRLDHPPLDMKVPGEDLAALLADESVARIELEALGHRVGVTLTHDDTTTSLGEILTYPDAPAHGAGAPAGRVLNAAERTLPGVTVRDMVRLSTSLAQYGPSHDVACDLYADARAHGALVAAHTDRFLALISNATGARTGTSERVRHVGVTTGRGSTFIQPLDVWPELLQEVPL